MTVGIMDNSQIDRYVFVNEDVKNNIKFIFIFFSRVIIIIIDH